MILAPRSDFIRGVIIMHSEELCSAHCAIIIFSVFVIISLAKVCCGIFHFCLIGVYVSKI